MASPFSPPEPSSNEEILAIPQRTRTNPGLPDIFVTYNRKTNGFKVKNASIEETALWIKSQNGQTFKVVRDKYGAIKTGEQEQTGGCQIM